MPVPPQITPLPAAPSRSEGQTAFNAKADPFIAALPPMVTQTNAAIAFINETAVDASEAIEASATAVAAKNAALASANNAAASATAAESAQGSIGNLALIHSLTIGMMRRF